MLQNLQGQQRLCYELVGGWDRRGVGEREVGERGVGERGGGGEGGGGEGGGGEQGGEEGGDYLTLSHCRLYEICQDSCW